jgi:hypothetical protein
MLSFLVNVFDSGNVTTLTETLDLYKRHAETPTHRVPPNFYYATGGSFIEMRFQPVSTSRKQFIINQTLSKYTLRRRTLSPSDGSKAVKRPHCSLPSRLDPASHHGLSQEAGALNELAT